MSAFLDVHRLEFVVTYRCNSHCKHCQVGQALRTSRPEMLDATLAAQIVRRVAGAYDVRSVMCWGGEPLLYPGVVCAVHRAAMENGIASRSVISNAGVPRDEAAFREVANRLAESGVNSMYISVDAFHQEYVPIELVERNARALVGAGIDEVAWNPCWAVSREHDNTWNRQTREILKALSHLPIREDEGNVVQPDGNALKWLASYLPSKRSMPAGSCEDVPYGSRLDELSCIGIEPDGGVSICYEWTIGNAGEEDILEILDRYDPYVIPEAKALLEGGVPALSELARARGIDPDLDGYYSICDLCRSLRAAMQHCI
jgi:MoaA/NifB/PqqE/SkfB family radical SAM enzyme